MKGILLAIYLSCILSRIECALPEHENNTNNVIVTAAPDISDACVTPNGQIIKRNEIIPAKKGDCYGIKCNFELKLTVESCGMAVIKKGCHGRWYDFSQQYPTCCPAAVCPN